MSKQIALDIGNVLIDVDFTPAMNALNRIAGSNFRIHEVTQIIDTALSVTDIGLSNLEAELFKVFSGPQHIRGAATSAIMGAFTDCINPIEPMTKLLEELHNDHSVALLSNIGQEHASNILTNFPEVFRNCHRHFSCDVGARKPSKLYFQSFLHERPEYKGCIFVDDREENVEAAKRAGFDAVLFSLDSFEKDYDSAALELRKILLD